MVTSPKRVGDPEFDCWNEEPRPYVVVYPAWLRSPQVGQPLMDTAQGNETDKDGLKLQLYPVQSCPSESLETLALDPQCPFDSKRVTDAATTGFVSLIFSNVIVGGGFRGLGWSTAV
jgi:hypothetical protein